MCIYALFAYLVNRRNLSWLCGDLSQLSRLYINYGCIASCLPF
nr:MAG TPA: hypothetical protein [Caudoviricetes sp.]